MPRWVIAVGGLFALALAAVVIGLASGGGDGDSPGERASSGDRPAKKANKKDGGGEKPVAAAPAEEAPGEEGPAETVTSGEVPEPQGAGTPAKARSLHLEGHAALQRGDYDTAIELNTRAIEAFPVGTTGATDLNYAYALFSLGRALRLAGRPEEAIPVLEKRLETPNQQGTVREELEAAKDQAGGE